MLRRRLRAIKKHTQILFDRLFGATWNDSFSIPSFSPLRISSRSAEAVFSVSVLKNGKKMKEEIQIFSDKNVCCKDLDCYCVVVFVSRPDFFSTFSSSWVFCCHWHPKTNDQGTSCLSRLRRLQKFFCILWKENFNLTNKKCQKFTTFSCCCCWWHFFRYIICTSVEDEMTWNWEVFIWWYEARRKILRKN